MTELAKGPNRGDLVIQDDEQYSRESRITLTNGAVNVTVETEPVGQPIIVATGVFILTGNEAGATGIVIAGKTIPAGVAADAAITNRDEPFLTIDRPAGVVLNEDKLPVLDVQGNALVPATLRTAYEALGFVFRNEPSETTVQT